MKGWTATPSPWLAIAVTPALGWRARGDDVGTFLEGLLSRLPLPVARRIEFLMGAILTLAGAALAVLSIVAEGATRFGSGGGP